MNNTMRNTIGDIEFEVRARLGILENYQTGWAKELNIISWNGGVPKYDIRDWNPDHTQMSKGVTMHEAEALRLKELLDARFNRPAIKGRGWDTAPGAEMVERERRQALEALQASNDNQPEIVEQVEDTDQPVNEETIEDEGECEDVCEQGERTEGEVA